MVCVVSSGSILDISGKEIEDISVGGTVRVSDNGILSGGDVLSRGYIAISSGTALDINVHLGGRLDVAIAGGASVISNAKIESYASASVWQNGSSVSSIISAAGTIVVGQAFTTRSGGTSIDDTVLGRGLLTVMNGGQAIRPQVSSGGRLSASYGGTVSNASIEAGGSALVTQGGTVYDSVISSGGTLLNSGYASRSIGATDSRGITSGLHVHSGGTAIINSGGVSYNDTADDGGSILINAYGSAFVSNFTASNMTVNSVGKIYVQEGGVLSNALVTSRGQILVSGASATLSGGTVTMTGQVDIGISGGSGVMSNMTIVAYGSANLWKNGSSVSSVISSGGTLLVGQTFTTMSGGVSIDDIATDRGILSVMNGGSAFRPQASAGGRISATNNGVVTSATINSGGLLYLYSAAASIGTGSGVNTFIKSGGTEIVEKTAVESGAIIGSGGTIVINDQGGLISGRLEEHGSIDFNYLGAAITSANITSDGLLTVRASNGRTTSLQLAGTYSHNDFSFSGDTLTFLCFLAGTHIRTPDGEVLVEDLRIGDIVSVWDWKAGVETTRKLRWVGRQSITVDPDLPDDEAGYPVRFLANCIAPNIPERDLLVTPEHCMFFDGNFVPARMLVNGVSIYYDKTLTRSYAYHVETEGGHSILWAESALSESYLDTGNRRQFFQHGPLVQFGRDRVYDWAEDAAAPLDVSRETVEALYERFAQRANFRATHGATTFDFALALKTPDGKVFRPLRVKDDRHVFIVGGDIASLMLVSNSSRPSEAIGPFVDDRRRLGVLVDGISVFGNAGMRQFNRHLQTESLSGWLPFEAGQVGRWTEGEALLPLHLKADDGPHLIAIDIIAGGPYLVPASLEKPEQTASVAVTEPALALSQ